MKKNTGYQRFVKGNASKIGKGRRNSTMMTNTSAKSVSSSCTCKMSITYEDVFNMMIQYAQKNNKAISTLEDSLVSFKVENIADANFSFADICMDSRFFIMCVCIGMKYAYFCDESMDLYKILDKSTSCCVDYKYVFRANLDKCETLNEITSVNCFNSTEYTKNFYDGMRKILAQIKKKNDFMHFMISSYCTYVMNHANDDAFVEEFFKDSIKNYNYSVRDIVDKINDVVLLFQCISEKKDKIRTYFEKSDMEDRVLLLQDRNVTLKSMDEIMDDIAEKIFDDFDVDINGELVIDESSKWFYTKCVSLINENKV